MSSIEFRLLAIIELRLLFTNSFLQSKTTLFSYEFYSHFDLTSEMWECLHIKKDKDKVYRSFTS